MPISTIYRLIQRLLRTAPKVQRLNFELDSHYLKRRVLVDVYNQAGKELPLLCFNDGQDVRQMGIEQLLQDQVIPSCLVVGIHANQDRMQEYGTAKQPDYAERGSKALQHEQFLLQELLPMLERQYSISTSPAQRIIAGFSLGGLAAFDCAWRHPEVFGRVGVFSGALWWRSTLFDAKHPDANRIIHTMVEKAAYKPKLRFWFQAGTADEESDRNNNGIIDAIDDTLQLIDLLRAKGYTEEETIYLEIEDGQHHPSTWAEAMPQFLEWALA